MSWYIYIEIAFFTIWNLACFLTLLNPEDWGLPLNGGNLHLPSLWVSVCLSVCTSTWLHLIPQCFALLIFATPLLPNVFWLTLPPSIPPSIHHLSHPKTYSSHPLHSPSPSPTLPPTVCVWTPSSSTFILQSVRLVTLSKPSLHHLCICQPEAFHPPAGEWSHMTFSLCQSESFLSLCLMTSLSLSSLFKISLFLFHCVDAEVLN